MTDRFDADILHREPMRTLIEQLDALATVLYQRTGRHVITRLSVTPDGGLLLGIAPGTSVDVATPSGRVEVYAERTPRSEAVATLMADAEALAATRIDPTTVAAHQRGAVLAAAGAMLGGIVQATVEGQLESPEDFWRALTDEQRHELASMACRGCGSLNTSCHCWNDE